MNDISVWRIEWWRLVRTRRLLALAGVFVFFGIVGPLAARYVQQLVDHGTNTEQLTIIVPKPVPADGISGYVSNALLIGLIVSVVIAAYACAVDANPALSVFYRTRVRHFSALILPRVTVTAAGVVGTYLLGLAVAWYETAVLIGAPSTPAMLYTALWGTVYLAFAVAVTAVAGTLVRSVSGTVGATLLVLLICPIVGELPGVSRWMPSALAGAPDALLRHTAIDHYPRALAVAAVLAIASVVLASVRGARREVP